jgi:hypothetical protein
MANHKGAIAAPKQTEPHPADVNPNITPTVTWTGPVVDKVSGQVVVPAPELGKRAEETRAVRRRRTDTTGEYRVRLGVNHDLLDHKQFRYHWINDEPGRIDEKTKRDDWDIVRDPSVKDNSSSEGAPVRQLVGAQKDGSALHAYLCRKPLEFDREDRAKKGQRSTELEAQLRRGEHSAPGAASTTTPTFYAAPGNTLSQAAKPSTYKP